MKKFFTLFALTLFIVSAYAQQPAKPGSAIEFEELSYDFGDISQGDQVHHIFKFKNTGTHPLMISEVVTTCGCTAPKWSKDPIMPGQSGEIQVTFNSENKMGRVNKGITVLSNATNNPSRLSIICNILPKKD